MNFSKLFLVFSIFGIVAPMPIQAAGLKSKALVGIFATAGSALATGTIQFVQSFKKDSAAQLRVAQLESELNYDYAFKDGLLVGVLFTVLAGCFITAMLNQPESSTGNVALGTDSINNDKELTVKVVKA